MAAAFLLSGQVLHADDSKLVPIKTGDKTTYIKVKQQATPSTHASWSTSSDKYNPMTFDLGRTSTLANKQFSSNDASITKSNSSFQQKAYLTKSYSVDSQFKPNTSNLNTKISTNTATTYDRNASGFDKSFATSGSSADQSKKALFASNTSEYQGRAAILGPQQIDTPSASSLAGKSYQGPEAAGVRHDLDQVNGGLSRMSNLPNRALTIDEVRDLINHGVKPDTNSKPEPASKPLNDPDYKPTPSPAPPLADDDKNDLIPSPGMVAAAAPQPPENSEPLPK